MFFLKLRDLKLFSPEFLDIPTTKNHPNHWVMRIGLSTSVIKVKIDHLAPLT